MERVEQVARDRRAGADPRRDRLGQGSGRARHPRAVAARARRRSCASTAARFPPGSSTPSCSATSAAASPARSPLARDGSSAPTAARCSSTRSAELPLAAQVRLLRVLQDGTFERVGGQKRSSVDVRIVAATHRNLAQMVAEGSFREDLWYRISVFPIRLPPLRERPEDLPPARGALRPARRRRLAGAPLTPICRRHGDARWPTRGPATSASSLPSSSAQRSSAGATVSRSRER